MSAGSSHASGSHSIWKDMPSWTHALDGFRLDRRAISHSPTPRRLDFRHAEMEHALDQGRCRSDLPPLAPFVMLRSADPGPDSDVQNSLARKANNAAERAFRRTQTASELRPKAWTDTNSIRQRPSIPVKPSTDTVLTRSLPSFGTTGTFSSSGYGWTDYWAGLRLLYFITPCLYPTTGSERIGRGIRERKQPMGDSGVHSARRKFVDD